MNTTAHWLRAALDRIGSPSAVSWPAFWVTFVLTGFGNLVTTPSMPVGARIVVIVGGQAVLWAMLLTMAVIWLRGSSRRPSRPRPGVVLVGFVVAATTRAMLVAVYTASVLGTEHLQVGIRMAAALTNLVPALVITALVVSLFRERREQVAALTAVHEDLARSLDQARTEVVERNDEVVARIRTVIANELAALDAADAGQALEDMQRIASDVVRPLSHELAQGAMGRVETPQRRVGRVDWSTVLDSVAVSRPFRPIITTGLLAFSVSIAVSSRALGAGAGIVVLVLVAVLLTLANQLLARAFRAQAQRWGIVLVVGAALVTGLVTSALMFVGTAGNPLRMTLTVTTIVFVTVFSLATALASAVLRDRDRVIADLDASSAALRHAIARLRLVEWFQQQALSRALHGPVQTAVAAAAIRIDGALRDGAVDPQAIEQVRSELLASLDVLVHPTNRVSTMDDGIARMSATWEGIITISTAFGADAVRALDADDPLRSCVIDIATEAVSNAVRHGAATRADIGIDLDTTAHASQLSVLRLRITSDASPPKGESAPGLGTRLIEDCTIEWELRTDDSGQTLCALLPLA